MTNYTSELEEFKKFDTRIYKTYYDAVLGSMEELVKMSFFPGTLPGFL